MLTVRQLVGLSSLLLLLGGCVTMAGRDEVMQVINEPYAGKVVGIKDFRMGPKMGYTLEPEGLEELDTLGVVCKDDEAMLQKTFTKLSSSVYCENGVMAKEHIMLIKTAIIHSTDSPFNVIAKHFDAWVLQAKIVPGEGDSFTCTDRAGHPLGNSFTDCTFTYAGKTYFIAIVHFLPMKFDNVRQILIVGNVQDASEEAKSKTRELSEKIAASIYFYFY